MSTPPAELVTKSYRCLKKGCGRAFDHTVLRANFLDDVVTCPCGSTDVRDFVPVAHLLDTRTAERRSKRVARGVVAHSLPRNMPGADSYATSGAPRFESDRKYRDAAKRFYQGSVTEL